MKNDEIIKDIWNKKYIIDELPGKKIPGIKRLRKSDGYYVKGTCIFIDLKDSSNFTSYVSSDRKTLRRIFASFHLLMINVIKSFCSKNSLRVPRVEIAGDGLYCVFDIQDAQVNVLFDIFEEFYGALGELNSELVNRSIPPLYMGIGMHIDDSLVFKLDGRKHIIWTGDLVNYSSKFSALAFTEECEFNEIIVSKNVYQILSDKRIMKKRVCEKISEKCYGYEVKVDYK